MHKPCFIPYNLNQNPSLPKFITIKPIEAKGQNGARVVDFHGFVLQLSWDFFLQDMVLIYRRLSMTLQPISKWFKRVQCFWKKSNFHSNSRTLAWNIFKSLDIMLFMLYWFVIMKISMKWVYFLWSNDDKIEIKLCCIIDYYGLLWYYIVNCWRC